MPLTEPWSWFSFKPDKSVTTQDCETYTCVHGCGCAYTLAPQEYHSSLLNINSRQSQKIVFVPGELLDFRIRKFCALPDPSAHSSHLIPSPHSWVMGLSHSAEERSSQRTLSLARGRLAGESAKSLWKHGYLPSRSALHTGQNSKAHHLSLEA